MSWFRYIRRQRSYFNEKVRNGGPAAAERWRSRNVTECVLKGMRECQPRKGKDQFEPSMIVRRTLLLFICCAAAATFLLEIAIVVAFFCAFCALLIHLCRLSHAKRITRPSVRTFPPHFCRPSCAATPLAAPCTATARRRPGQSPTPSGSSPWWARWSTSRRRSSSSRG